MIDSISSITASAYNKTNENTQHDDEASINQPISVRKQLEALKEGRQKGLGADWQAVYNSANDILFWICPKTGKSYDRLSKALRASADSKQQEESSSPPPPRSKSTLKRGTSTAPTVPSLPPPASQSSTHRQKRKHESAFPDRPAEKITDSAFSKSSDFGGVRRTSRRNPNLFDRSQLNLTSTQRRSLRSIRDHLMDANQGIRSKSNTAHGGESSSNNNTFEMKMPKQEQSRRKKRRGRDPSSNWGGPIRRKVDQLCLKTGEVIATFDTIAGAAESIGMSSSVGISLCCNGRRNMKSSGGFGWRFSKDDDCYYDDDDDDHDDDHDGDHDDDNYYGPIRKKVDQLCLKTGRVIASYDTIADGAEAVGMSSPSGISQCCNGRRNMTSSGGFGWRFSKEDDDDDATQPTASTSPENSTSSSIGTDSDTEEVSHLAKPPPAGPKRARELPPKKKKNPPIELRNDGNRKSEKTQQDNTIQLMQKSAPNRKSRPSIAPKRHRSRKRHAKRGGGQMKKPLDGSSLSQREGYDEKNGDRAKSRGETSEDMENGHGTNRKIGASSCINPQDSGAKAHSQNNNNNKKALETKKSRGNGSKPSSGLRTTQMKTVIDSELLFLEKGEARRMTRGMEGKLKEFQEFAWDNYVEKIIKRVEASSDGYWV